MNASPLPQIRRIRVGASKPKAAATSNYIYNRPDGTSIYYRPDGTSTYYR
jgi:hypothetical protein